VLYTHECGGLPLLATSGERDASNDSPVDQA